MQVKINGGELIKDFTAIAFPMAGPTALQVPASPQGGEGAPNLTPPASPVVLLLFSQSQCYGGRTLTKRAVPWRNSGFALCFLWVVKRFQAGEKEKVVRRIYALAADGPVLSSQRASKISKYNQNGSCKK